MHPAYRQQVARLLVQAGAIEQDQLAPYLADRQGSLTERLVSDGLLTNAERDRVHAALAEALARRDPLHAMRSREAALGRLAVSDRLVSSADVAQAEQEARDVELGGWLQARGLLTAAQLQTLRERIEAEHLVCRCCGELALRSDLPTECLRCGGSLAAAPSNPAPDHGDPFVGRTLATCTLLSKLGEGGMGAVYLARHESLGIEVAVKVLPAALAAARVGRERFVREARTIARLDHPGIVRVMDVGCQDGTHFLVMELVRGGTLHQRLRRGPLPVNEAVGAVAEAADALAVAHRAGVIHRDIKPENLMLTDQGRIKVADFGLARDVDQSSVSLAGAVHGTPAFMSPEQAGGLPVDARTDIYALGVTLYALLTGRSPFVRDSLLATLRATSEDAIPPLGPEVPAAVQAVIASMTAKEEAQRPATCEAVATALRHALVSGPTHAHRPDSPPSARPGRPADRATRPASAAARATSGLARRPASARRATASGERASRPRVSRAAVGVGALAALAVTIAAVVVWSGSGPPSTDVAVLPTSSPGPRPPAVESLLTRVEELERRNQAEEALALLAEAARLAPGDTRVASLSARLEAKVAAARTAKAQGVADAAATAVADARARDTAEAWAVAAASSAAWRTAATTDADRGRASALEAEARARGAWADARACRDRGDLESALRGAAVARDAGLVDAAFEAWVTDTQAQLADRDRRARRKRELDELVARASPDMPVDEARELWGRVRALADDPADVERARAAEEDLARRAPVAMPPLDAAVRSVQSAIDQRELDRAARLLEQARALGAGDPRIAQLERSLAEARARVAYDTAVAEAARARQAGWVAVARAALRRALEARPGDREARAALDELAPQPPLKVVAKGPAIELTLDAARKITMRFLRLKGGATTTIAHGAAERRVTVSREFAIALTEMTQAQWTAIMPRNPSRHVGPELPVEMITWWDAIRFVEALNERLDGWTAHLPSEAQWELACRAGTTSDYSFGSPADFEQYVWSGAHAERQTHPVATLKPNPWGLFDTHGNVWEWIYDGNAPVAGDPVLVDHVGLPDRLGNRLHKGGDESSRDSCQSWARSERAADDPSPGIGLRLILVEGRVSNPHLRRMSVALDPAKRVKLELVRVPAQAYWAGAKDGQAGRHVLTLSHDYWIQTTEVTRGQWAALMGAPDDDAATSDRPMDRVSWTDAQLFLKKLSARCRVKATLPTEAEWELACRADTHGTWYCGDDERAVPEIGWVAGTTPTLQPVARLRPNSWGLYDLSGGAAEWCLDWYATPLATDATDPTGPTEGADRVVRGGSYRDPPAAAGSAARHRLAPDVRQEGVGFRVVLR